MSLTDSEIQQHRLVYLEKTENARRAVQITVDKLALYLKTYNHQFFEPPFNCAKKILGLLEQIADGLKEKRDTYSELISIGIHVLGVQIKQFNRMAFHADKILKQTNGFTKKALIEIYKEWIESDISLRGRCYMETVFPTTIAAHQMFMETFKLDIINIFCTDQESFESLSVSWDEHETGARHSVDDFMLIPTSSTDHLKKFHSTSSLDHTKESELNKPYKRVEDAEFEEFLSGWVRILEKGDIDVSSNISSANEMELLDSEDSENEKTDDEHGYSEGCSW